MTMVFVILCKIIQRNLFLVIINKTPEISKILNFPYSQFPLFSYSPYSLFSRSIFSFLYVGERSGETQHICIYVDVHSRTLFLSSFCGASFWLASTIRWLILNHKYNSLGRPAFHFFLYESALKNPTAEALFLHFSQSLLFTYDF